MFAFLENLACLFSRNTCYEISPFFAVSCLRSKISEIRMPPKILFYLNHEIKMPQKKFLDQNAKLKCRETNFKNSSVKIKCYIKYVKIFLLLFFQWKEKQALKILHRAIFIKKTFFGIGIDKSRCRVRQWRWQYFQTRKTFFWCF